MVSLPIASNPCLAAPSRINELTNYVPSLPPQEFGFLHEPIPDNVHGDLLRRAPVSSFHTMAQIDPIEHRLTSATQASTSGRCETDLSRLKEDPASMMKTKLGVDMGNSRLYQKPYPAEFDLVAFS